MAAVTHTVFSILKHAFLACKNHNPPVEKKKHDSAFTATFSRTAGAHLPLSCSSIFFSGSTETSSTDHINPDKAR